MKKMGIGFTAFLTMLTANGFVPRNVMFHKPKKNPKMDLSVDEFNQLEKLSGKEKKKFIKALKLKYGEI